MPATIFEVLRQIDNRPVQAPRVEPETIVAIDSAEYGCVDWYHYETMRVGTRTEPVTGAPVTPSAAAPSST